MTRKAMALFAAVLVVAGALACAGQPTQETQEQTAPASESTAQAPAQETAPAEGAAAPTEAPAAPMEGEAPAEAPPQN